ncbi:ABC transporter permease [Rubrobacter taiwanensis]|jgi:simple sugar transport system permease protein|uniref:ABC transporter permease n=1 Tax=Rubrobacter taiwanensis TaxID=185139 RepID=A0A4R1B9T1_9ACTN|nr:ABC transporter permease [Rubrobacter taiwanensis]TCJ13679.1 ABC transporter permease [Rubrobacter taiwanensis]
MATQATAEKRPGFFPQLLEALVRRQEAGILVVSVGLILYFYLRNPAFLTQGNIQTLAQFMAATAIVASGLVMVMILGEIDLSVGQAFAFAPIVMWIAYDQLLLVLPLAVVIGLLATAAVGLVNGVMRVFFGVPSFVATLGMFFLLGGLNVILVAGFPKPAPEASWLKSALGAYPYAGIMWALVILAFMHVLLNYTRWGMHTFATGGNFIGAREAGIRVDRIRIGNFMLCSMLGGFAGILEAMRINSIDPLAGGAEIMFLAISAAVIGGTPLAGGIGTVFGAFLGALALSVLRNGFTLQGVSAFTFNVILGITVLIVMVLNVYVITRLRKGRRVT